MTASADLPLSWREAAGRLSDPAPAESFSPLFGAPLFAVDFAAGARPTAQEARLRHVLRGLPCPTVALHAPEAPPELRDAFDVVLDDEGAPWEALRARVAAAPLAAQVLVQLLRAGESLALDDALVAESLAYSVLLAGPEFRCWLDARRAARSPESAEVPVLVAREGGTLRLVLNRPERRNAWGIAMRDACAEALAVAAADPGIARIELRGAGPAFCAGGDLDEFGSLPDPATAHAVRSTRNVARQLAACADRVHVRVHGACVGAGAELPAFAARVTAAPDAWFALPELEMGLVPGAGGTASLPRRIGRQRTARLALGGERLDAETALAWGLVDEIEGGDR